MTTKQARVDVLGCEIDRLDTRETLRRCDEVIASGRFAQHVCINAAKLVALYDDPRIREVVERCEIVSADGQSIVWASKLLGEPLPERVNGTELMFHLLALAQEKGYGVFILGAKKDVLVRAVERLRASYPRLRIVGYRDGYFSDAESADVAAEVRAARPEILFVAISSPRKEYWLAEHGRNLGVPFVMGVGGSIDVAAGVTRWAPPWMRRAGLEWLFRLLQEPRRMGRRYLVTNARFIGLLGRELVRRRTGGQAA
jgi:N-acetylglucosaminyldiphosphoundecaprenol N-acetyl-beta-D-mannosaminyltransferase